MRRTRPGSVLCGLLLVVGVSACSGAQEPADPDSRAPAPSAPESSGPPSPSEGPTETADGALTDAALAASLLTTADLPAGFQEGSPDAGSATDTGCLSLTGGLDAIGAESSARVRFVSEDEVGAAGLLSKVYSDSDVNVLRQGLNRFATALRDCTQVDAEDDDGARTRLEVTTDRRRSTSAVEQQVNFTGVGTVSGAGSAYPYRIRYSVSLLGRALAVTAGFEVGDSSTALIDDLPALASTVLGRLAATGATE